MSQKPTNSAPSTCYGLLCTYWIGAFDPEAVRRILGIPPEIVVVELLPLGYPREPGAQPKSRLPLDKLVHNEQW